MNIWAIAITQTLVVVAMVLSIISLVYGDNNLGLTYVALAIALLAHADRMKEKR